MEFLLHIFSQLKKRAKFQYYGQAILIYKLWLSLFMRVDKKPRSKENNNLRFIHINPFYSGWRLHLPNYAELHKDLRKAQEGLTQSCTDISHGIRMMAEAHQLCQGYGIRI